MAKDNIDKELNLIADDVENMVKESVVKEVGEEFKISLSQLKQGAQAYIREYNSLQKEVANFESVLKRQSQLRKANRSTYETIDEYINNKEDISNFLRSDIPRRLFEASFKFQNLLNMYLGQKVTMVYVFDDGTGPELYEIKTEDILSFDYSSRNKLVARYNATSKNMQSALTKLQIDEKLNFNMKNLKDTYKEVIHRYRKSRSVGSKVVLWQVPQKIWHAMKVSAEGDINEAYASFVILNQSSPSFNYSDIEYNIQDFMVKGVAEVDNMSGLLKGDVTKGNIEYGIKSANASTLSLNQIIKLANEIANDANYSKEKLLEKQEEFFRKKRIRNKIINLEENKIKELVSGFDKFKNF